MTSSSDSSSWYTSTAQSSPLLLMQHLHLTLAFKPLILFPPTLYLLPVYPHHRLMLLAVSLYLLLSLPFPNSIRVLQWNAGGLQARSTKLLHFISSYPVDHIYIQDSNLNLSSSFRIPGFSALRPHGTHSRSGIFSTDVADASGGVIIFIMQGLFFSKLSISSLSSLGPYSYYVEVNISLNDFSSLSFLNVCAPLFILLRRIAEPISFLSPFFTPTWKRWIFCASPSSKKGPLPSLPLPASTASTSVLKTNAMVLETNCDTKLVHSTPQWSRPEIGRLYAVF